MAGHPDDDAREGPTWVRHARRDVPPVWQRRWERARRFVLLLGGALVLLAVGPALAAGDPLVLRAALSLGWVGLVLMLAALWQPARYRVHAAWLVDVRPPMDDDGAYPASLHAACGCGWRGPDREVLEEAVADADAHAHVVDPDVERPLG